jgi:hypothetical protein
MDVFGLFARPHRCDVFVPFAVAVPMAAVPLTGTGAVGCTAPEQRLCLVYEHGVSDAALAAGSQHLTHVPPESPKISINHAVPRCAMSCRVVCLPLCCLALVILVVWATPGVCSPLSHYSASSLFSFLWGHCSGLRKDFWKNSRSGWHHARTHICQVFGGLWKNR